MPKSGFVVARICWLISLTVPILLTPAVNASPIAITLSVSSNLNTNLVDSVLVYAWSDSTSLHFGTASLPALLPSGSQGPFNETISTPTGFVSGEATILGLYPNPSNPGGCPAGSPCGVGMVFNTTAGSAAIGSSEPYTTAFPSAAGYPSESALAALILTGNSAALAAFFMSTTGQNANNDWTSFTLATTNQAVDLVLFSNAASGGTLTINSVTPAGVPEPGSLALVIGGLGAVAWLRRRNSRARRFLPGRSQTD
jgi:hypothetical protein